MTSHVVSVLPQARPGDTVLVDGRPMIVLDLLPLIHGRPPAARMTSDLPCGTCEDPLHYDALRWRWRCSECQTTYDRAALVDLVREHVRDGVRAGNTRRDRGTRVRQVVRGAPGAAAVLLRAVDAGGALSRAVLLNGAPGAERRALAWAPTPTRHRPASTSIAATRPIC